MSKLESDRPSGGRRRVVKWMLDKSAFELFLLAFVMVGFVWGLAVGQYKMSPYYDMILKTYTTYQRLRCDLGLNLPLHCRYPRDSSLPPVRNTDKAYKGINLITRVSGKKSLAAEIVDMEGKVINKWDINWFDMWPDAKHLPAREVPRWLPGTHIHGAKIMENGDLLFNFEYLGLLRLAPSGKVVWRLPYQTHHSIHQHDDGNLWVCGRKEYGKKSARFPNCTPPFGEDTILVVSPDGKIIREWSVAGLLKKNNMNGLLFLGTQADYTTQVSGDVLHLNDVEPFPASMKEGFFNKGDVLVSLRNINTVFVFDSRTDKIKFIAAGMFVRQHDPDFVDGDRFSVLDNNLVAAEGNDNRSRIVIVSAPDAEMEVYYEGTLKHPFYTDILGKHQWLPNGNLLITEARQGRAFEVDPNGKIVWEYVNYVGDGVVGNLEEVTRLPLEYARLYVGLDSGQSGRRRQLSMQ